MKIDRRLRPERVVSTDDTRYQIEDPYLDVEHKVLVATNGWALVALPVEVAEGETSRYVGCRLLDMARTVSPDEEIEILGDQVGPDGPSWPTDQDRKFPAWREVLPKKKPGDPGTVTVGLDATQLRAIALALGAGAYGYEDDDAPCQVAITIDLDDPDGASALHVDLLAPRAPGAVGVLKPCRVTSGGPCIVHVPPKPKEVP